MIIIILFFFMLHFVGFFHATLPNSVVLRRWCQDVYLKNAQTLNCVFLKYRWELFELFLASLSIILTVLGEEGLLGDLSICVNVSDFKTFYYGPNCLCGFYIHPLT